MLYSTLIQSSYFYVCLLTKRVHSSTGSMIYRLPHVLVSRVASGRVLGTAGLRVLLCKYKRLVWPVYIETTRGSLPLRGRRGPLWAVVVCCPQLRVFVCPPVSSIVKQLTLLRLEAIVLCTRVRNHAAAYECKEIGISHAPISQLFTCSNVAQGSFSFLPNGLP